MKTLAGLLLCACFVSVVRASDTLPGKVLVPRGAAGWRFLTGSEPPSSAWARAELDDSEWKAGAAPLGYGEDDIATAVPFGGDSKAKLPVAWFRMRFDVGDQDREGLTSFAGRLRFDDGAVVYVNGSEVLRKNKSANDSPWADETTANESEYLLFKIPAALVVAGQNIVAVSVHQANGTSSDLVLDLELRGLGPAAGDSSYAQLEAALTAGRDVGSVARSREEFEQWLAGDETSRVALAALDLSGASLSRDTAARVRAVLVAAHARMIRERRARELKARTLTLGELKMRFSYKIFGEKPEGGRSLFISMHGGGGTAARVNDSQWENQKRLYEPAEGIYLAPRAPTDTWNLWHQAHIDRFFDRLIEDLIVLEDVDPNRVYIMGYSAGGDGVYQLAPRMADRLAAAAMMAGHPNETKPLGLRNIGFTLHVGGRDRAYRRNEIGAEWKTKLAALRESDPDGYRHEVRVHPDKPHWMDREDRVAVPWMAAFTRDPIPQKVVWYQDDVTHERFYWLALPAGTAKRGQHIVASRKGQAIELEKVEGCERLIVLLDDAMLDLDEPVEIVADGKMLFRGRARRNVATITRTLGERGDPKSIFAAEIEVDLSR